MWWCIARMSVTTRWSIMISCACAALRRCFFSKHRCTWKSACASCMFCSSSIQRFVADNTSFHCKGGGGDALSPVVNKGRAAFGLGALRSVSTGGGLGSRSRPYEGGALRGFEGAECRFFAFLLEAGEEKRDAVPVAFRFEDVLVFARFGWPAAVCCLLGFCGGAACLRGLTGVVACCSSRLAREGGSGLVGGECFGLTGVYSSDSDADVSLMFMPGPIIMLLRCSEFVREFVC